MFMNLKDILDKYNLNFRKVLHVGACDAEEEQDYFNNGCKFVYWVEANQQLALNIEERLDAERNKILNYAISDTDYEEVSLYITNNLQSSSILEMGTHSKKYPNIYIQKKITIDSRTIRSLVEEKEILIEEIDFINLDIQGAELKALRGCSVELLNSVKAIYTEINTEYVYKECCLVDEIDDFLASFGFKRVETFIATEGGWGDALYIKTNAGV